MEHQWRWAVSVRRLSGGERVTNLVIIVLMILFCFVTIYPVLYSIAYSLSDSRAAMTAKITIFPVEPTLDNYANVFRNDLIIGAFMISVFRAVVGALYALVITGLAAYALSKPRLPGNRAISIFLIIPMFVTGGLIPTYVLIYKLGLFNNLLVYILPHGFWAFNMILMRSYFNTIPDSMEESARMDGARDLTILIRIIVPLSMPIIATIIMFEGVGQWNAWFDALIYVPKQSLQPLQLILQKLIREQLASRLSRQAMRMTARPTSPESVRMATLVVTTVPIVIVYPFLQRYFIKGMLVGAVKA